MTDEPVSIGKLRKVMPIEDVPKDIVGVSPMCGPKDSIFNLRKKFEMITIQALNAAYQRYQNDRELNISRYSKLLDLEYQWEMRPQPDHAVMIFVPYESEDKGLRITNHIVSSDGMTSVPDFLNDYI